MILINLVKNIFCGIDNEVNMWKTMIKNHRFFDLVKDIDNMKKT